MGSTTENSEMQLPFPHGIEVELQVIRNDGTWIRGENILQVFDKIVSSAKGLLDKKIRTASVDSVKRKYKQSAQTEEGERGSRIVAAYEDPKGEPKEYTLLGHDPNVTSLTWILEVATPPCTTLEELAWWIQTLIAISQEALPADSKAILISTGLNPTQEYLRNLSFGEHHHILSPSTDEKTKIAVYNMIRNLLPHLIALSVNSPFENKKPSDEVSISEDGLLRAPRCKRSIRLFRNTTQMGPTNEFELIPYLRGTDKEAFARHVNRSYARMVDMYPFTDYGTIEIRVFDTQLSIPRRMGLALLLQALALKAKRMVERGEPIPDVGPKTLAANREAALSAGLWGPFRPGEGVKESEYVRIYNNQITDDGLVNESKRNRFLGDAVVSMLYLIKDELEELNIIENPFIQALLVSVFGSEYVEPRTTGADFQLEVYTKSDNNMVVLMKRLSEVTRECSTNWLYDPIEGTPHLPTWLCWWKGLEPEIIIDAERVFAGQDVQFSVLVRNSTGRQLENITISYSIEDSERNVVENNVLTIPSIQNGEIQVSDVSFMTRKNITAYNIIAEVGFTGRVINLTSTINMYWMKASISPGTTTQFADGKTPVLFNGQIETNYPTQTTVQCQVSIIAPIIEKVLVSSKDTLQVESGEPTKLDNTKFLPILVPSDASDGVQRCMLQLSLFNQDGTEIAEAMSKPFYIGFVKRGPQVVLNTDLKSGYKLGDLVSGDILVSNLGKRVAADTRLLLEFRSDSGRTHLIEEFLKEEFVGGAVSFHWKIPLMAVESSADRVGIIKASLKQKGKIIASAESDRVSIEQVTTRVNIDSLRIPQRAHIGGKVSGWLRIRRNTESGDPAVLNMTFVFPDGDEHHVLSQPVKQSKNLSIAFGPIVVPAPRVSANHRMVTLVATLSYAGVEVDRRSSEIDLMGGPHMDIAQIEFVGLPNFTAPDELIQPTIKVTSNVEKRKSCILTVELESVGGNRDLLIQELDLDLGKERLFPIPVRIPLGAEMSTAHLRATLRCGDRSYEKKQRFKIKAIENPLFKIGISIRNESGDEIPGLVARLSNVEITATVESVREKIGNLTLSVRIMSRRDIVKEFEVPLPDPEAKMNVVKINWITPPIDVVTGYYIDAVVLQSGRPLPTRAVELVRRQFTVY
ncbi:MAG: Glutamate--cysteine ligase [Candidatus Thorarchaeota archaeon AB_25]|nr:MAG: Glutamate--cysteine ligase [Candidatus Thorarchaeota archaeon AB_25]